jgi:hypothetical protein
MGAAIHSVIEKVGANATIVEKLRRIFGVAGVDAQRPSVRREFVDIELC